jgi:hypothetical protein
LTVAYARSRRRLNAETRKPEKAAAFSVYCDYFWLVVSDASIVRPGELPVGWGLIVLTRAGTLTARVPAKKNAKLPLPWPMTVGLMRAVQKTSLRAARQ